jgi:hypothetical protein
VHSQQQQQQMLARQQRHAQRTQQRGSAVGIACVGGGDSSSSSCRGSSSNRGSGSGSSLPAGPLAPAASAGSSVPQAGAGAPASGGLLGFKPESMVALLKTALQRNMRMSAPKTRPAQQGDSSSSSVGGSEWGGISTVNMEPVQMWCIACQEPAYLLATAGYCGKHCCVQSGCPCPCIQVQVQW